MNEKPTLEQLEDWYVNDNKHFMEIANYYYNSDSEFYSGTIQPIITKHVNPPEPSLFCPKCQKEVIPIKKSRANRAGLITSIVVLVIGIVYLVNVYSLGNKAAYNFAALIFMGFLFVSALLLGIRDKFKACPYCKTKLV